MRYEPDDSRLYTEDGIHILEEDTKDRTPFLNSNEIVD